MELKVNGRSVSLDLPGHVTLLEALRNDLHLNGPKYGCGYAECGACTVLVDGQAARACAMPLSAVAGREVITLEGLGNLAAPHPVQRAFIEMEGAQCGYCLNGMIMTVAALLAQDPRPDRDRIRRALRYNLCRCGTHQEILAAAERAVVLMAENAPEARG